MKNFIFSKSQIKQWVLLYSLIIITIIGIIQPIHSHGTVTYPPSRVYICYEELLVSATNPVPSSPACFNSFITYGSQAFYDWNEVSRMDGDNKHETLIPDGNLASAGRPDKYGGLDQVRDDWIATSVNPGPFTMTWTNTAPHQTLYYRVYITPEDWTTDQPLTWDNLELLVETEPRTASATDNIDLVLPQRLGKHVLFSVWQRSLSAEAFYSTSDVDFGETNEPTAPVSAFTFDNGICGGPEVTFNAEGSYDVNGDTLTYFWDFGDGNTAEGIEVTHTFANGVASSDVELTVSDKDGSTGDTQTIDNLVADPNCEAVPLACAYGAPTESSLPALSNTYESVYAIGELAPDLSNITSFAINWNGSSGLFQFDFNFSGAPYYLSLTSADHSLNQSNPQITIEGTGINGLDGEYYTTTDGDNFVLVSKSGGFTVYFSADGEVPDCDDDVIVDIETLRGGVLFDSVLADFEFTVGDGVPDYVSGIMLDGAIGDNTQWIVTDLSGNIEGLPNDIEQFNFDDIVNNNRSLVYSISYNGSLNGLTMGESIFTNLSGEYAISNSIEVYKFADNEIDIEDVVYDESDDGDLATVSTSPTVIQLSVGNNVVISSQTGDVDQGNFFTFEVPSGFELSRLVVMDYEGVDDIGFIGINEGTEITGGGSPLSAPNNLIGGLSYGTAHIGTNILPEMGNLDNPAAQFINGFGFTPPLASNEYTVWLNQTGGTSNTTLNFVITVAADQTPDPVVGTCTFDTPRDSAMPIMNYRSYNKSQGGSITVFGENGPDLTHIRKLDVAYSNNAIGTFLLNEWSSDQGFGGDGSNHYLEPENTFSQNNPTITLEDTGIDNLDGTYYTNVIDNEDFRDDLADFVMVSITGGFSIYFTYSEAAPECTEGTLSVNDLEVDNAVTLLQNYPNPFSNSTTINYELTEQTEVNLNVYNLLGQLVKSFDEGIQTSGSHEFTFDLNGFSNGIYLYILKTNKGEQTKKMILNKE